LNGVAGSAPLSPRLKIPFHKLMSYTGQMASRSLDRRFQNLVRQNHSTNEQQIAARLALLRISAFIKLERLRHARTSRSHSKPATFLPPNSELTGSPVNRESLFKILEREYQVELGYADEEGTRPRGCQTAELLSVPRGEPLNAHSPVDLFHKGKAITYVLGFYRSDGTSS